MKVKIVNIGNSRGIRIPKVLLRQTGIDDEVNLEVDDNQIILRPLKKSVREGWNNSFIKMAEMNDDRHVQDKNMLPQTSFDEDEWEW
jgi:antitoxin MazE